MASYKCPQCGEKFPTMGEAQMHHRSSVEPEMSDSSEESEDDETEADKVAETYDPKRSVGNTKDGKLKIDDGDDNKAS